MMSPRWTVDESLSTTKRSPICSVGSIDPEGDLECLRRVRPDPGRQQQRHHDGHAHRQRGPERSPTAPRSTAHGPILIEQSAPLHGHPAGRTDPGSGLRTTTPSTFSTYEPTRPGFLAWWPSELCPTRPNEPPLNPSARLGSSYFGTLASLCLRLRGLLPSDPIHPSWSTIPARAGLGTSGSDGLRALRAADLEVVKNLGRGVDRDALPSSY